MINRKFVTLGSNDPDDLIVQAFRAYENEEKKIEAEIERKDVV